MRLKVCRSDSVKRIWEIPNWKSGFIAHNDFVSVMSKQVNVMSGRGILEETNHV